ncbi:MAG: HEAT repeat domain-containing protein [Candidatus Hydrogenedentes bacterium]|nr:HEAT repeat domain-containing protein [Candidatus Hydrogenedentota bacterium]
MYRDSETRNRRAFWGPALHTVLAVSLALLAGSAFAAEPPPLEDALKQIATYEFGQNREMLSVVEDYCRLSYAAPETRSIVEEGLISLLKSDATYDCKDFVCRQLCVIGSDKSVPVLGNMLTDEKLSNIARYALEGIEGKAADKAFIKALGKTSGKVQIGIINSLGARGSEESVRALAKLLDSSDPAVAQAAAAALGHIGGVDAAKAIADARAGAAAEVKQALDDGYLLCAAKAASTGRIDDSMAIYSALNNPAEAKQTQLAAIQGIASVQGPDAAPMLIGLLKGDDPKLQAIAAGALRKMEAPVVFSALAGELPNLGPQAQLLALYILRQHPDAAAKDPISALTKSEVADVRIAAIEALGSNGDASSIPLLAEIATGTDAEAAKYASSSLDTLPGDVDVAFVELAKSASAPVRGELIRSMAVRGAVSAVPYLLESALDADSAVRTHAFDALGALGSAEQLSALMDLLVKMNGNEAQTAAENAIVAVVQKSDPATQPAAPVIATLQGMKGKADVRASFVRVLGRTGDASALPILRECANAKKGDAVKDAAIRALADWPTAETLADLQALASGAGSDTNKALAFRGFMRLLRLPADRPMEETLRLYGEAFKIAASPDDKRLVLAGLAEIKDARALSLVEPLLSDEAVKAEAAQAAEQIKKNTTPQQ